MKKFSNEAVREMGNALMIDLEGGVINETYRNNVNFPNVLYSIESCFLKTIMMRNARVQFSDANDFLEELIHNTNNRIYTSGSKYISPTLRHAASSMFLEIIKSNPIKLIISSV